MGFSLPADSDLGSFSMISSIIFIIIFSMKILIFYLKILIFAVKNHYDLLYNFLNDSQISSYKVRVSAGVGVTVS